MKPKLKKKAADIPSWYPLPIYSSITDVEDWAAHIAIRIVAAEKYEEGDFALRHFNKMISFISEKDSEGFNKLLRKKDIIAEDLIPVWPDYARPTNSPTKNKFLRPAVIVDLSHDDETLVMFFKACLSELRERLKETGFDFKHPSAAELVKWRDVYKILPLFDLELWAKLNSFRYSDALLARTLWPPQSIEDDKFFDPEERLRKTVRPKMKTVFSESMAEMLMSQARISIGLKAIEDGTLSGETQTGAIIGVSSNETGKKPPRKITGKK